MKTQILFFSLLILAALTATAQEKDDCGTRFSTKNLANYKALVQASNMAAVQESGNVVNYVPVHFHITRTSAGVCFNGYTLAQQIAVCDSAINLANVRYKSANLQFYRCLEPDVIDNDQLFSSVTLGTSDQTNLVGSNFNNSVINIFLTTDLIDTDGTTSICGVSRFPWDSDRFIILAYSCLENESSFPHELGHYFGLLHTHETSNGAENVDRNSADACYNCATTGDLLCDTPADPGLSSTNMSSPCNYTGTSKDGCNTSYTPDPSNLMSYSFKSCRTFFSAGQIGVIMSSYTGTRQAQLDNSVCNQSPCYEDIFLPNTTITVSKKVNAQKTITSEEVIMTPASDDVQYDAGKAIVMSPGFHAKFGVRFHAFIDGCFIPPFGSEIVDDRENNHVEALTNARGLVITPNPADDICSIKFRLPAGQTAMLRVLTIQGQTVRQWSIRSEDADGDQLLRFDCSQLPAGIYGCVLDTETGSMQTKLIISR